MTEGKTVSVSFRVSPLFKRLLETAAAQERRSQTNLIEHLLFSYCEARGIAVDGVPVPASGNTRKEPFA